MYIYLFSGKLLYCTFTKVHRRFRSQSRYLQNFFTDIVSHRYDFFYDIANALPEIIYALKQSVIQSLQVKNPLWALVLDYISQIQYVLVIIIIIIIVFGSTAQPGWTKAFR